MSDAPILSAMNMIADLDSASDFEKKHTPHIDIDQADGRTLVSISVGHYVGHPNQADHYIQWIELQAGGNPIARFELSPMATAPRVSVEIDVDPGTTLRAIEYCNLHGLWAAETTV